MQENIKIAGIPIQINSVYDSLGNSADDYKTQEKPQIIINVTVQDIINEEAKSKAECAYEKIAYPNFTTSQLENTAIYRKIAMELPKFDATVFHGSAVAVNDEAYLFTAKSGTGKTTHTNLWLQNINGSYIINGDKPILRIIDGKVNVCGTPWMGKEGLGTNKTVPLKSICFLRRGEQNKITHAEFNKVMPELIGQSYRPPNGDMLIKTVKLLERIGKSVKLYELECNMEDEAALVAYEGMKDD